MTPTAALRRLTVVAAIAVSIAAGPACAQELAGQASVIDGDTLEIHGANLNLRSKVEKGQNRPSSGQTNGYRASAA